MKLKLFLWSFIFSLFFVWFSFWTYVQLWTDDLFYTYNWLSKNVPTLITPVYNFRSNIDWVDWKLYWALFKYVWSSSYNYYYVAWWRDWTIHVYESSSRWNYHYVLDKFTVCSYTSENSIWSISDCNNYYPNNTVSVSEFVSSHSRISPEFILYQTYDTAYWWQEANRWLCFAYPSLEWVAYCYLMPWQGDVRGWNFSLGSWTATFSSVSDFLSEYWNLFTDSPFYSVPPSYEGDYVSTYQWNYASNMFYYRALVDAGYHSWLCYWDFDLWSPIINDMSDPWVWWYRIMSQFVNTDCDDWESFCGANFFQLYSWSSFSTYSFFQTNYSLFKYTYNNNDIWPYVGREKWLRRLNWKIFTNDFSVAFSPYDYITFCDMTINWFDPQAIFNSPISESMKAQVDMNLDIIIWGWSGTWYAWSWQVEAWLNFDNETKSYEDILWRFKYKLLNNKFVFGDYVWVLPSYIALWFLFMLLLYLFRR